MVWWGVVPDLVKNPVVLLSNWKLCGVQKRSAFRKGTPFLFYIYICSTFDLQLPNPE